MSLLPIPSIQIGSRFRQDLGDLAGLARSIKHLGLLQPIVVDKDNNLVCGRRRLEACRELGWQEIPVNVVDIDALLAERDENACRKDFTPSEAVAICKAIEEREKPKAAERQKVGKSADGEAGGRGRKKPSENFSEGKGESGKAKAKAAKAVGMSRPTYEKAKAVTEAAEKDPEGFGDLKTKMDGTGKVDPAFKEMKERQKVTDPRPASKPEPDPDNNPEDRKSRGKGVRLAHEAINSLQKIPKTDGLRKEGFRIVKDWIRRNE